MKKRKKKKINENKNIIYIGGGIVLAILLYFIASPYQQCVRGYVSLHYDPSANYYDHAEVKREAKAMGRIACQKR
jgi:hypothetical protein